MRWVIRKDMLEISEIENRNYDFPWDEKDFISVSRKRNNIGVVFEKDFNIEGYMFYGLQRNKFEIFNLTVDFDYRRKGIGTKLIDYVKSKLNMRGRHEINFKLRETNLDGQLFLQKQGFRSITAIRNYYDDSQEDLYYMAYKLNDKFFIKNRISEYFPSSE